MSESAVEHLKNQVKCIKISKVQGENVETVCSQIKSACQALQSASTPTRSCAPDDFASVILDVMQTSSDPEFNSTFKDEKSLARREADKLGGIPNWPTVTEILNQAENVYRRLLRSNK